VDPGSARLAQRELAERLAGQLGIQITFLRGRSRNAAPASVEVMFQLERIIGRITGPRLTDRVAFATLAACDVRETQEPDVIIDFCGGEDGAPAKRTFVVLYDGVAGEAGVVGALVNGRMPIIEIADVNSTDVVASAHPCSDNAATFLEVFECVLARVITLLAAVIRNPEAAPRVGRSNAPAPQRSLARFELKALAHRISHRLYSLCFYTPHWRTCWRFTSGAGIWQTRSLGGTPWNVIPDPGFRFFADPFPFRHKGRDYVFVEDLDHRSNKGVISVIPFDDKGPAGPPRPVIEEPWHLSYPFLIEHDGHIWMMPESSANKRVLLYRAADFPYRWVPEAELLTNVEASDATVILHNDYFWMFAATRDGWGSWSDILSIYHARSLKGPWQPHQANPVLIDQAASRPAGSMILQNGQLWRPVQDCTNGYGTGIGLAEVQQLDMSGFRQKIHAVLRPDATWPGHRLHTLNGNGRIECVDGSAYSPRNRHLARRLQNWSGRRDIPMGWRPICSGSP
jgi:hypothetical protein